MKRINNATAYKSALFIMTKTIYFLIIIILGYISLENTLGNIASMCELAVTHGIRPVLNTLIPTEGFPWRKGLTGVPEQIQTFNQAIRTYARDNGFLLIDLAVLMADDNGVQKPSLTKDGVHPTLAGYKIMEEAVLQALQ